MEGQCLAEHWSIFTEPDVQCAVRYAQQPRSEEDLRIYVYELPEGIASAQLFF